MRMTGKNQSIKTARIKDVAELDPETLGESTDPGFTFKYIDLSSVKGGRIGDNVESMTFAAAPGRARKLIKEGDILLGMVRPYLKPFAKVQRALDGHVASTGFAVIRAKSDITDPEYLYQTIWSDGISKQIHQTVTGSNYPALSVGDVKDLKVPLPPLAEQRKIAEILRTWDEAIEAAEAELKAKQERKRGLMQKILSPGGQIKAEKTNSFRESVKRFALPSDWRWMFVRDVAKVSFSSVDKKSVEGERAVRLCNYMDVFYNRRIREGMPFMVSTASESDIKKFTLNKGDVVLTKDSETPEEIAFAAVIDEQIDKLVCGYHLAVLRPDNDKVTGEYLMSAINFHPNHHQFIRLANGATRFGLGIDSLNNAVIPVPPMDVQRNIAEILKSADAEVELINKRIDFLRIQKRGIMQKLLTGEVRVAA